jgi:hypothetical protein
MSLKNRLAIPLAVAIILALIELSSAISGMQGETTEDNVPNLSYIWSVSGLESNQVTMALNQAGKDLYGAAKYEPDNGMTWNAIVIGSIDGNNIDLVLTSLQGNTMISSRMIGTYDVNNQSLKGEFFQANNSRILKRGNFYAIGINPNISDFIPANEGEASPDNFASSTKATSLTPTETVQQKSIYYDVHQNADSFMHGIPGKLP